MVFKIMQGYSSYQTIGDFKKFTANSVLKELKKDRKFDILDRLKYSSVQVKDQEYKIWKRSCHPKAITTEKFLNQKTDYTDYNALKYQIVKDIENYPYTSYHNRYCKHPVVLEIDSIDLS